MKCLGIVQRSGNRKPHRSVVGCEEDGHDRKHSFEAGSVLRWLPNCVMCALNATFDWFK